MAEMQGAQSEWRDTFAQAAELHMRAADLPAHAVTYLLMLRASRDAWHEPSATSRALTRALPS
jgi:hypothetical protein